MLRGIALASVLAIPALAQSDSSWSFSGSVSAELGYHSVVTQKNETGDIYVSGKDTIQPGDKYRNYFKVPGLYGGLNAFLQMESPTGKNSSLRWMPLAIAGIILIPSLCRLCMRTVTRRLS